MSKIDLDELADELAELAPAEKQGGRSPKEERIIAGFEEIQRFVAEHGRLPRHGDDHDIFERIYAVRLDRLRKLNECRDILAAVDVDGLLGEKPVEPEPLTVDDLADELGGLEDASDLTELRHVRSAAEKKAAEEIANRTLCDDFEKFEPVFVQVQTELESGIRTTRPFELKSEIEEGRLFIVDGQKALVAEKGEVFSNAQGRLDARLRVIFDNGTESNMLMRSLQRALHKDDAGRRITEPAAGPLFGNTKAEGDTESGTIYVLLSKSEHPEVARHRQILHKIGVTGSKIETRIANAKLDPTFLMADVEIVATYDLVNINRVKLENLLHRFFASARLDLTISDRFGNPIKPREWFLVPRNVIDSTIKKIQDGSIADYEYDPSTAKLKKASQE